MSKEKYYVIDSDFNTTEVHETREHACDDVKQLCDEHDYTEEHEIDSNIRVIKGTELTIKAIHRGFEIELD